MCKEISLVYVLKVYFVCYSFSDVVISIYYNVNIVVGNPKVKKIKNENVKFEV